MVEHILGGDRWMFGRTTVPGTPGTPVGAGAPDKSSNPYPRSTGAPDKSSNPCPPGARGIAATSNMRSVSGSSDTCSSRPVKVPDVGSGGPGRDEARSGAFDGIVSGYNPGMFAHLAVVPGETPIEHVVPRRRVAGEDRS